VPENEKVIKTLSQWAANLARNPQWNTPDRWIIDFNDMELSKRQVPVCSIAF
jgi:hypothetical protein